MDMDGTLTLPRKKMKRSTLKEIVKLKDKFRFGIVSGSDFDYIEEQCKELLSSDGLELKNTSKKTEFGDAVLALI